MKKILFIEDDKMLSRMYALKFSTAGYQTEVAEDGLQGMKKILSFKPDLVVLDLMMPKMNGVDVLKFVRAHRDFKNLPVVVLSNAYMTDLSREAAAAGTTLALAKSQCTPKRLVEIITPLLNQGQTKVDTELILFKPKAAAPAVTTPTLAPASSPNPPVSPAPPRPPAIPIDPVAAAQQKKEVAAFVREAKGTVRNMIESVGMLRERLGTPLQAGNLVDLQKRIRTLSNSAGIIGLGDLADYTSAIDAFLLHLSAPGQQLTPSRLETLSQAVELLKPFLEKVGDLPPIDSTDFKILTVDDDAFSLALITQALRKAGLLTYTTGGPDQALRMVQENHYDLLLLDVLLPGISGFDLCLRIRKLPAYQKTPVIFVTTLSEYSTQAREQLSQTTDLIAKPFDPMELAVKALYRLYQAHLSRQGSVSENLRA